MERREHHLVCLGHLDERSASLAPTLDLIGNQIVASGPILE